MTACQALLAAQILLDHTTVLVILDTWGMKRKAAGLKVRLQLLYMIKHRANASIFFRGKCWVWGRGGGGG